MPQVTRKRPSRAVILERVEETNLWRRRLGFVFALSLPMIYLAAVVIVVLTVGATDVPTPHEQFGPYEQSSPWVRWILTALTSVIAVMLSGFRARLVDTPVSDLAAARPGHWTYRGRVGVASSVAQDPRSVTLVRASSEEPVRAALIDETASVWIAPEAVTLGLFCRRKRYRYHLGDTVTVCGWCGIADNGELVLGEHPSIRAGSFPMRRRWLALLGDGHNATIGVTVLAVGAGLSAVALWVSLFTVETWETASDPNRSSTASQARASAIVFRESAVTYLAWSLVGAAVAVSLAWLISVVNRLVRVRGQAVYAASVVQVAEVERRDLIEQMETVVTAASDHDATLGALDRAGSDISADESMSTPHSDPNDRYLRRSIGRQEQRIASARRFHIDALRLHDDLAQMWPHRWVARLVPVPPLPD